MKLAVALIFAVLVSLAVALPPHFSRTRPKASPRNQEPAACPYLAEDGAQPAAINLKPLLDKYQALVDFDDIEEFIRGKLESEDPDSHKLLEYFHSDGAKRTVDYLWEDPVFPALIKWVYDNGLTNIYNDFTKLHEFFGWRPIGSQSEILVRHLEKDAHERRTRSIGDLVEEFTELVPVDQMINLTLELITMGDETLLALIARMSCPEVGALWFRVKELPDVQDYFQMLREEGVQIDYFTELLESMFGWRGQLPQKPKAHLEHEAVYNLAAAWERILSVIDVAELKEYWNEFQVLPCGQFTLDYVRGPDFGQLITDFYKEEQFINIMNWMQSHGLDHIYEFNAAVHAEVGIAEPPYPRQGENSAQPCTSEEWGNIRSRLNTFIPQDKLSDTIYELIRRDESVQELMELLAVNQVDSAYHHFIAGKPYQIFIQKLLDAGFKIDDFITIVEALMGWDNRPRHNFA